VDLTHVFSPTLTNEFVGSFTFINFPNSYANPDAVNRFKLGYPYHGFFANGIQQIPNISGSNNQVATLSNNSGLAAGHNMPSGTYSAIKPMAASRTILPRCGVPIPSSGLLCRVLRQLDAGRSRLEWHHHGRRYKRVKQWERLRDLLLDASSGFCRGISTPSRASRATYTRVTCKIAGK